MPDKTPKASPAATAAPSRINLRELGTDGVHNACCQRNATQQPTKPAGEYPPLPPQAGWGVEMHGNIVLFANNAEKEAGIYPGAEEMLFTADQMRAYGEACWKDVYKHAAQRDAEDAARYRWLRKYVGAERIGNITSVYLYIKQPQTNLSLLNETDSAIDAARSQLEGKQ